ncbi:hypothetical protein BU14_0120s0010 [Porphyra umbilicalis]|uniref:Uncharacterized protein n=1 Tax=Porphyra umbilicalis TaxID=2786 RepID=A0A1X6PBC1_PORUM|nr:hypothetical protein BU14_0120s0010 [Porphyra umbilicalis]|eukprot:OSX78127.1 hypothetical protein BU14_0120s0010 [Porphyra umbilicalis]
MASPVFTPPHLMDPRPPLPAFDTLLDLSPYLPFPPTCRVSGPPPTPGVLFPCMVGEGIDPAAVDIYLTAVHRLHDAVRCGRSRTAAAVVDPLIVDAPDGRGWTPLMVAAEKGNALMTRVLLAAGADVRLTGPCQDDCVGPLHLAAAAGATDVMGILLAAGAPVNKSTPGARITPLMAAAAGARRITPAVRSLLRAGADADAASAFGETALHIVARSAAADAAEAAAALTEMGVADVAAADTWGDTPLDVAARAARAAVPPRAGSPPPLPPRAAGGRGRPAEVTAVIEAIVLAARRRRAYGGV